MAANRSGGKKDKDRKPRIKPSKIKHTKKYQELGPKKEADVGKQHK